MKADQLLSPVYFNITGGLRASSTVGARKGFSLGIPHRLAQSFGVHDGDDRDGIDIHIAGNALVHHGRQINRTLFQIACVKHSRLLEFRDDNLDWPFILFRNLSNPIEDGSLSIGHAAFGHNQLDGPAGNLISLNVQTTPTSTIEITDIL
jgi:hypothetical protein